MSNGYGVISFWHYLELSSDSAGRGFDDMRLALRHVLIANLDHLFDQLTVS